MDVDKPVDNSLAELIQLRSDSTLELACSTHPRTARGQVGASRAALRCAFL